MQFRLYDRWGTRLGNLCDVITAKHTDELNGEDSLNITMRGHAEKGWRLVWGDEHGVWHEHVIASSEDYRGEKGIVETTVYAESSIAETYGDYIVDKRPRNTTALAAIQTALQPTRWAMGRIDDLGIASTSYYHISAREALSKAAEAWGGELETVIDVDAVGISRRAVSLVKQRGSRSSARFVCGTNLTEIRRSIDVSDVYTALYGYGKGEETDSGGYGRKISFGSINGGLDYIVNEEAKVLWGLPDGKGGTKHVFGKVEFNDCEDPAELLALTRAELPKVCTPKISYECSVSYLKKQGMTSVCVGDIVTIIDRSFTPELRLQGRIVKIARDLLNPSETLITIGNIVDTLTDIIVAQSSAVQSISDRSGNWDAAASVSIADIIHSTNKLISADSPSALTSCAAVLSNGNFDPAKPAIMLQGGALSASIGIGADGSFAWYPIVGSGGIIERSDTATKILFDEKNYIEIRADGLYGPNGKIKQEVI
ncbi:MAG: phage tail spike protein [Gordonibacter sp.]|uniref:phage tail spike protein n=1 Tax=Gordonibacter sp. TaxID=1968902 RepID=UPI002FCB0D08